MCVFLYAGSFVNGIASGVVDTALHEIAAMRLLVHSDSDVWVLLSEVSLLVDQCEAFFDNDINFTTQMSIFVQ